MIKTIPTVGDHLYTYTPCTSYYVRACRDPWTVIEAKGNTCVIQEAELVFYGPRYFNTLPDLIRENPNGRTIKLRWSEKNQRWQESPNHGYPRVAVFGKWDYFPYLD